MKPNPYLKAGFAAVVAFLGALIAALSGEETTVSPLEWVTAVLAAVVAAGGVWQLPYAPKPPKGRRSAV